MATCHRCGVSKRHQTARCGNCGAGVTDLSGMAIDEVSFVPRGANQDAHITLFKSDNAPAEPKVTVWGLSELAKQLRNTYRDDPKETVPDEYAGTVAKVFADEPQWYDDDIYRQAVAKSHRADLGRVAELAKAEMARDVDDRPRDLAHAMAKVLTERPELYDAAYGPQGEPPRGELVKHDVNPRREQQLPGWVPREVVEEAEQREAERQERLDALSRRTYGGTRSIDRGMQWGWEGKFQ